MSAQLDPTTTLRKSEVSSREHATHYSRVRSQIGPFSCKKPSSAEHPGPPTDKPSSFPRRPHNTPTLRTVRPEHKVIDVRRVGRRPEPSTSHDQIILLYSKSTERKSTHQKNSLRVSFASPEIGIKPAHDGPASHVTTRRPALLVSKARQTTQPNDSIIRAPAPTFGDLRPVDEELCCPGVRERDQRFAPVGGSLVRVGLGAGLSGLEVVRGVGLVWLDGLCDPRSAPCMPGGDVGRRE